MVLTPTKYTKTNEEFLQSPGWAPFETIETNTSPFSPFLLIVAEKEGNEKHFVIDKWEGHPIGIDNNGELAQTFTGTAHKASEEEIKEFLKEDKK